MTLTSVPTAADALDWSGKRRITGAHALMHALRLHGVDTIFGYPGGAILPIYDARGIVTRVDGMGDMDNVSAAIEAALAWYRAQRDLRVDVEKHMTAQPPRRIAKLEATIHMPAGLAEDLRDRLIRAANACPVKQSLHPDVEIALVWIW